MSDGTHKTLGRMAVAAADAGATILGDPVLSRSSLVRALGEEAGEILAASRVGRIPAGGVLFRVGQPASSMLLVASGELVIHAEASTDSAVATTVAVGEVVGAGPVLGEPERRVTVTAPAEATVVEIPAAALRPLCASDSDLRALLEAAESRDASASDEMAAFLDRW